MLVDFPKYISEIKKQKWWVDICEEFWHKYEKKFIYLKRQMSYCLFVSLLFPHRFGLKLIIQVKTEHSQYFTAT